MAIAKAKKPGSAKTVSKLKAGSAKASKPKSPKAASKKAAPKAAPKKSAKPAAKKAAVKAASTVKKKAAAPVKVVAKSKAAKVVRTAAKAVTKAAKKAVAKAVPARKAVAKAAPAKKTAPAAKPQTAVAPKSVKPKAAEAKPAKTQVKPAAKAVPAPAAQAKAPALSAAKAARKSRRVPRAPEPLAAWIPQAPENRPRPASFIPAPPRAESPSTVAAPPASSDRLFREDDLSSASIALRTFPIRVDIEQSFGRAMVSTSPSEIVIRPGDALEWDFRYLGGMDVIVERVVIEFQAPSPFSSTKFKSSKPGSARPHRQLSGACVPNRVGTHTYLIRCFNSFDTEVATGKSVLTISA